MGPHYSQHTNTYLLLEKCNVADVEMGAKAKAKWKELLQLLRYLFLFYMQTKLFHFKA